jgi:MoxR-like ATPase
MEAVAIQKHEEHKEKIKQVYGEVERLSWPGVYGQPFDDRPFHQWTHTVGRCSGLAKTLTVSTLAQVLHLDFQRIQFTPDLLPADLVGTMIYNQKDGSLK